MTSVQYQMAIAALDRLVDAGGPFILSAQIGAPVRREKRVIRVVNSLILMILMLFVSPSISDSMETSAYYSAERDKAYQDKDNMAELVGTLDSITRPVTPVPYQVCQYSQHTTSRSGLLWDGGRS
jgi:hypothetical protein